MFHIDLLTLYKETEEYGQAYMRPPPITVQSEEEYEVESILQAQRKTPSDSIEYKVHWKGYPSADDSWVPHKDLHSPDLLKEFYTQGGKVQTVKRRRERLRRLILSLSCLPSTTAPTTPPLVVGPHLSPQMKTPFGKYNEQRYTPRTLYKPSRCSTQAMKPTTATTNKKDVDSSSASPYRCSATTTKPGMPPRTFSIPLPEQSAAASSSQGRTTKPHRPQEGQSSMESYRFSETTPNSIPPATPLKLPAARPWLMWTSCSLSETRRCLSKNSTSSGRHGQPPHMSRTRGRHPQTSTIACAHPPPKSWKNSGLYPETTGTETSRGWCHSTTTLSPGWEGDQSRPPSTGTTLSPTTPSSFSLGDTTVPVIHAPLERGKTPTPEESSLVRRHTLSSPGKPSR
jgi:chromodomain-containing protein